MNYQNFINRKTPDELQQWRESRRAYDKIYRETHKEHIKDRNASRLIQKQCDTCGSMISDMNISRHLKTKVHLRATGMDIPDEKRGPKHNSQT